MSRVKSFEEGKTPEAYLVGYALRHGKIKQGEAAELHPEYADIEDKTHTREFKMNLRKKKR
jgi:hypothetical protein